MNRALSLLFLELLLSCQTFVCSRGGPMEAANYSWAKTWEFKDPLNQISAVDASHAWAAGHGGVLFYDGEQWSLQFGLTMDIQGICAHGADLVWAAGEGLVADMEGTTYEGRKIAK